MRNVLAAAMIAALIVFFTAPQPKTNPSDEAAFAQIVESALDSNSPARLERWHAAQEQVMRLDPNRPNAAAPFVRSGLFHWTELSNEDRQRVLTAMVPLVHDDFGRLAEPFFQLTGDFTVLRRADPGTVQSMGLLTSLAITNGRFAEYRTFREQLRKRRYLAFEAARTTATPADLIALVPIPATTADTPLLLGILNALQTRPVNNNHPADSNRASALIDFALDHNLQPLDGLQTIGANDPQRARLALALGQSARAGEIEAASNVNDRAQWHRYYIERALDDMRRHDSLHALQYLQKGDGKSPDVTAAMEQLQRMAGNNAEAAAVHAALVAKANRIEQWNGLCGSDLCERANGTLWSNGAPFALKLASVQSDNVPPYAEVYTDDALTGEGPVAPAMVARAELLRGIHRVEVRLANPVTRNAIRRRIRIE
ncbi:MAG TPA: hypothetical protein VJ901_01510 [Thermoanaerobaculia bacterium]|nr:hypothetical protein [Thermoanaerobaculia bacterium]